MKTVQNLEDVADQYRAEGYRVVVAPTASEIPDFARGNGVDLLAYKGDEHVIIEVKTREALRGNSKLVELARVVNEQPGWRLDLVVLPGPNSQDRIVAEATEPSLEQIDQAFESAERLVEAGELTTALLIAWASLEATMRRSARAENIEVKSYSPLFLLRALYSMGLLEPADFDSLSEILEIRNTVAHGMNPPALDRSVPLAVAIIARKLIAEQTAQTREGAPAYPS
jgi:hypothetical protein